MFYGKHRFDENELRLIAEANAAWDEFEKRYGGRPPLAPGARLCVRKAYEERYGGQEYEPDRTIVGGPYDGWLAGETDNEGPYNPNALCGAWG